MSCTRFVLMMKKGRTKKSGPRTWNGKPRLENEFRSQLNRARSSRAYRRVRSRHVGRGAAAAERLNRRIVQAEPVLSTIRISEIRMVEYVEELGTKLQPLAFAKMKILSDREVKHSEPSILKHIAAHISELTERGSHHHRVSRCVAAEQIPSRALRAWTPAVGGQSRRGTTSGHVRISRCVERNADAAPRFEVPRITTALAPRPGEN